MSGATKQDLADLARQAETLRAERATKPKPAPSQVVKLELEALKSEPLEHQPDLSPLEELILGSAKGLSDKLDLLSTATAHIQANTDMQHKDILGRLLALERSVASTSFEASQRQHEILRRFERPTLWERFKGWFR